MNGVQRELGVIHRRVETVWGQKVQSASQPKEEREHDGGHQVRVQCDRERLACIEMLQWSAWGYPQASLKWARVEVQTLEVKVRVNAPLCGCSSDGLNAGGRSISAGRGPARAQY